MNLSKFPLLAVSLISLVFLNVDLDYLSCNLFSLRVVDTLLLEVRSEDFLDADLDSLLEICPGRYYHAARIGHELGKINTRKRYLIEGSQQSDRPFVLVELGWLYFEDGHYQQAKEVWSKAGTSARYLISIGPDLERRGELDKARRLYQIALELEPDDRGTHRVLGNLLLNQAKTEGELWQVIRHLEASLGDDLNSFWTYISLARAYEKLELLGRSLDYYKIALAARSGDDRARLNIGRLLVITGASPESIPYLKATIANDPQSPTALYWLGRALISTEAYEEGMSVYEQALRLRPEQDIWRAELAYIYLTQLRIDEGCRHLREIENTRLLESAVDESLLRQCQ